MGKPLASGREEKVGARMTILVISLVVIIVVIGGVFWTVARAGDARSDARQRLKRLDPGHQGKPAPQQEACAIPRQRARGSCHRAADVHANGRHQHGGHPDQKPAPRPGAPAQT